MDTIYFRRLNAGNQAEADALHAQAIEALGLQAQPRKEGSF